MEEKIEIFKALSDKNRLLIIDMLSCGELCACDIIDGLNLTQPTVSHHMKILGQAGLVNSRKEGKWTKYSLKSQTFEEILDFIKYITSNKKACICKINLEKCSEKTKNMMSSTINIDKNLSEEEINEKERRNKDRMNKIKILVVCVHNSSRSQMAEEFLTQLGGDKFLVESAGINPGTLNPLAVDVMAELGYDISKKDTNSVFEYFKEGRQYNYVIKVCDSINGERCPIFPGVIKILDWNLQDPSSFKGTHEERLEKTRMVRNQIKERVIEFIESIKIK